MFRQGDVLIEEVDAVPQRPGTSETLLVRGEGRNHGHFILGDVDILRAMEGELTEGGGIITHYLDVKQPSRLEHLLIDSAAFTNEHHPILIPPGRYRVVRQREYNPYARAIRAVND